MRLCPPSAPPESRLPSRSPRSKAEHQTAGALVLAARIFVDTLIRTLTEGGASLSNIPMWNAGCVGDARAFERGTPNSWRPLVVLRAFTPTECSPSLGSKVAHPRRFLAQGGAPPGRPLTVESNLALDICRPGAYGLTSGPAGVRPPLSRGEDTRHHLALVK
jgi:hypothetical protein